jgi:molybdopterin/thiamine biosynthesis adenylyltransferase
MIPPRFNRNLGILTPDEQERLLCTTVCVVGLGCTGCAVTEFLARAGIGAFVLVDGDRFEESNINRQLYARVSTVGEFKAEAAKKAVRDINPDAQVTAHSEFLSPTNAAQIIESADVVINGLDDAYTMVVLHRTARAFGKPSVFLLSGCIPFQGICTILPADSHVEYETFMSLPSKGLPLEPAEPLRALLFEKVTKARIQSALRRGAIPGDWVERRMRGTGSVPSFGPTSNITAILAALETIKLLIRRPGLSPVCAPDIFYFDGAKGRMEVRTPKSNSNWFQGDF